jgi:glyoxylase-like metal-dependent hydrolase (beta-lactamase superfamily II)
MKQVLPGIFQWSWYSPEKQLDFNGLFLTVGEHRVLVDPPPMTGEARTLIRKSGRVDYVVITNRDHEREAAACKAEFGCQVWVPEADAAQMEIKADRTYKDGELLPGGIWAVHLRDQKSPGECALYFQQGRGVLIVGDALIGKPAGSLSMLPAEKYADPAKAREGLTRLLKYDFDALLVGDGASILAGAKDLVARTLQS